MQNKQLPGCHMMDSFRITALSHIHV